MSHEKRNEKLELWWIFYIKYKKAQYHFKSVIRYIIFPNLSLFVKKKYFGQMNSYVMQYRDNEKKIFVMRECVYVHLCELSGHTKFPVAIAWAILPSSLNVSMESDGGVELSEGLSMDTSSSLSCSNCCLELDWEECGGTLGPSSCCHLVGSPR